MTHDMGHVTHDMWHVTHDTLRGMNILSKFLLPSSNVCDLLYYEDIAEKADLLTD